jgi:hypothetical protein
VSRACSVRGCDRPAVTRGLCTAHYKRWLACGDVRADVEIRERHPVGENCQVPGCGTKPVARGLCLTHYRRRWRGKPVSDRQVGEPDGYGRWGILDADEEGVLCHECGRRLQALSYHLKAAHGMTADRYRDAHGLPRSTPLVSPEISRILSASARARIGSQAWHRLEDTRDPQTASRARDDAVWDAVSRSARQHRPRTGAARQR